jgi:hypothetical protein
VAAVAVASTVVEVAAAVVAVAAIGKTHSFNAKSPSASAGGLFGVLPQIKIGIPNVFPCLAAHGENRALKGHGFRREASG